MPELQQDSGVQESLRETLARLNQRIQESLKRDTGPSYLGVQEESKSATEPSKKETRVSCKYVEKGVGPLSPWVWPDQAVPPPFWQICLRSDKFSGFGQRRVQSHPDSHKAFSA